MKRFSFVVLIVAGFLSCSNGGEQVSQSSKLDLSQFQTIDIPGSNAKRVVRTNEDGKVMEEGIVENGERNGTWVIYHADRDVPKLVANFIDDQYNGPYFEFNKQGQVDLQCSYVNNLLEGYFAKYRIGRKTEEGSYAKGKLDGVYKKYYESRSLIQRENTYKNGQLDGKTRFYDEQGNVIVEYVYEDGKKVSGGIVEQNATANIEE